MINIYTKGYRLTPRRLSSLARTAQAAVCNGGGIGWDTSVSERSLKEYFKHAYKDPHTTLILAADDDTNAIVGSVQLKRPHPIHSASALHRAEVLRFFVHPQERRKGFGGKLLDALLQVAREHHIQFLCLDVRETQKEARTLYEKMGFSEYARHPHYAQVNGVMCEGILMYRQV